jgi:hypothetical protein
VTERRPSRHLGPGEVVVLVVAGLLLVHQVDHVLRADVSGWPFTGQVTWFTASLVLFPALVAAILLRRGRIWARVALAAALLVAVQGPHMFWETPADQYGTWAHGVSWLPAALGRPNLPGIASPALGVASVAVAMALSVAVPLSLVLLAGEGPTFADLPDLDLDLAGTSVIDDRLVLLDYRPVQV